jgi:hypothetical protein
MNIYQVEGDDTKMVRYADSTAKTCDFVHSCLTRPILFEKDESSTVKVDFISPIDLATTAYYDESKEKA